jgi:hypothetical protein
VTTFAGKDVALAEVYVTRAADASTGPVEISVPDTGPLGCFRLHRVEWQESGISADGSRVIYRFLAPDAESVRIALRQAGISYDTLVIGSDHRNLLFEG